MCNKYSLIHPFHFIRFHILTFLFNLSSLNSLSLCFLSFHSLSLFLSSHSQYKAINIRRSLQPEQPNQLYRLHWRCRWKLVRRVDGGDSAEKVFALRHDPGDSRVQGQGLCVRALLDQGGCNARDCCGAQLGDQSANGQVFMGQGVGRPQQCPGNCRESSFIANWLSIRLRTAGRRLLVSADRSDSRLSDNTRSLTEPMARHAELCVRSICWISTSRLYGVSSSYLPPSFCSNIQ